MKTCEKCGIEKFNDCFSKSRSRKGGLNGWCKVCMRKYHKEYLIENRSKLLDAHMAYRKTLKGKMLVHRQNVGPRGKYRNYKANAKNRKISFNVTFEQFMTFWQKPCHYCGCSIETIGLDRVNNYRGYDLDNMVSCCQKDNKAKLQQTHNEYVAHCIRVAKHILNNSEIELIKFDDVYDRHPFFINVKK